MVKLTESLVFLRTKANDIKNVKKLNCWGCNLDDISLLQEMPLVEVLSLSVNSIEDIKPLVGLKHLKQLYLRKNNISDPGQVRFLAHLPSLVTLWLDENPIADIPGYRNAVIAAVPSLKNLDDKPVTDEEHQKAISGQHDVEDEVEEEEEVSSHTSAEEVFDNTRSSNVRDTNSNTYTRKPTLSRHDDADRTNNNDNSPRNNVNQQHQHQQQQQQPQHQRPHLQQSTPQEPNRPYGGHKLARSPPPSRKHPSVPREPTTPPSPPTLSPGLSTPKARDMSYSQESHEKPSISPPPVYSETDRRVYSPPTAPQEGSPPHHPLQATPQTQRGDLGRAAHARNSQTHGSSPDMVGSPHQYQQYSAAHHHHYHRQHGGNWRGGTPGGGSPLYPRTRSSASSVSGYSVKDCLNYNGFTRVPGSMPTSPQPMRALDHRPKNPGTEDGHMVNGSYKDHGIPQEPVQHDLSHNYLANGYPPSPTARSAESTANILNAIVNLMGELDTAGLSMVIHHAQVRLHDLTSPSPRQTFHAVYQVGQGMASPVGSTPGGVVHSSAGQPMNGPGVVPVPHGYGTPSVAGGNITGTPIGPPQSQGRGAPASVGGQLYYHH